MMDLILHIKAKVNLAINKQQKEEEIRRAVGDCGQLHVVSVAEIGSDSYEVKISILDGMMKTEQAVSKVQEGLMRHGIYVNSISSKGNFGEWIEADNYNYTDHCLSLIKEANERNARRQSEDPMIGGSSFSMFHKSMHSGNASSSAINRFTKPTTTHDDLFDIEKQSAGNTINLHSMNVVQPPSFLYKPNVNHSAFSSPASSMAGNPATMHYTSSHASQPSGQEDIYFNPMKTKGRFG